MMAIQNINKKESTKNPYIQCTLKVDNMLTKFCCNNVLCFTNAKKFKLNKKSNYVPWDGHLANWLF